MATNSYLVRKTISITFVAISVGILGNSDEVEVMIVDPSSHGSGRPVVSLEDPNTISDRSARVYALEKHCRNSGDLPTSPAESCIENLNEYFGDVPIWRGTVTMVYDGTRGTGHYSSYDHRAMIAPYDEVDYLQEDVPTWKDIFDGHERERLGTVARVFSDRACLTLREPGPIQLSYENRCEARDLFKFARYMDACITGISRSNFLNTKGGLESQSRYERARKSMDPSEIVDFRIGNGWQLVENYLLSILVIQKCMNLQFIAVDEYIVNGSTGTTLSSVGDLQEQMKPMYDASMAIAARAGDAWAIQTYYETQLRNDIAYWESVYEISPFVLHRWMSSRVGRRWFDDDERVLLAWQAFTEAKEIVPSLEDVAFDRYILDRGGRYNEADVEQALARLKSENWRSELDYPWNRVLLTIEGFNNVLEGMRNQRDSSCMNVRNL